MPSPWTTLAIVTGCQIMLFLLVKPWRRSLSAIFLVAVVACSLFANALSLILHGPSATFSTLMLLCIAWGIIPIFVFCVMKYTDPEMPPTTREKVWSDIATIGSPIIAMAMFFTWAPCGKHSSSSCYANPDIFPNLVARQFTHFPPFSSWTWSAMFFWCATCIVYLVGLFWLVRKRRYGNAPSAENEKRITLYQYLVAILLALTLFCWWRSVDEPPMVRGVVLTEGPLNVR